MPYVQVLGKKIYYEVAGEGPAIMFVHGSGGNHAAWWQQVPYFARRYKVVTIDLRGFGNSDPVPEGPDSRDFFHDILGVLDDAGIDRIVILGQSIGAAVAMRLAVAHPERVAGVILAHSLGGLKDPELNEMAAANRKEAEKLPVIDRLLSKEFQSGNPTMTHLFHQMGTFNSAKMADLRNLSADGPTVEEIIASKVPIMFLNGEKDAVLWVKTARRAHEKIPGSLIRVVPNGPHSLYWENAAVFNCVVDEYLQHAYGL